MASAGGLLFFTVAYAQIDAFTYFIPYPADILDDQFDVGHAALDLTNTNIELTVSIAVHRNNTLIVYDHWEDGLEPNPNLPTQLNTQIWGDNDPGNGLPPGFTTDVLNAGDVIVLRNVVVLPRDPATLFFDGGDMIMAVGGSVAITGAAWPLRNTDPIIGPLYAAAWELYPTNRWGLEYYIPVGEDLAGQRTGFTVVGLNVQAAQDGTQVALDLDANGSFETTTVLNRGQQFTQVSGVRVGAYIQATAPVQVHTFTADPASRYEARADTMISFDEWTHDLLAPRSSDGDFWIYNPSDTPLDVTVETITTTGMINVPAQSTAKYPPSGLSGETGIRFTAADDRPFYVLGAFDDADAQDWGYALQPVELLTTQMLVGLGFGNYNNPPDGDESPIYVTALTATTIFVDYNGNGTPDASFPVAPLQETTVTDPDHDMTGAFLYTTDGTPFLGAWGQDQNAAPALPSIDVGTSVVPLPSLVVQKTASAIADDADCTSTITFGDTLRFQLQYFNNTANDINDVIIEDNLPPQVAYVPDSTLVNGLPLPDSNGGNTPFPLDEGGYNLGTVAANQTGVVTFEVLINQPILSIMNQAIVRTPNLTPRSDSALIFSPVITTVTPVYDIKTTLVEPADGTADLGETVTFNVGITNTDTVTITRFPLQSIYDQAYLSYQTATLLPDATTPGLLSWDDLTASWGALPPGVGQHLMVSFIVAQVPQSITGTFHIVIGVGGEQSDGTDLPVCRDETELFFQPGLLTPTPTGSVTGTPTPGPTGTVTVTPGPGTPVVTLTPPAGTTPPYEDDDNDNDDDGGGDDGDDGQPPPPGGGGTPSAALPPGGGGPESSSSFTSPLPTSTVFPVALLPETGYTGWSRSYTLLSILGLGLVVLLILIRGKRQA